MNPDSLHDKETSSRKNGVRNNITPGDKQAAGLPPKEYVNLPH